MTLYFPAISLITGSYITSGSPSCLKNLPGEPMGAQASNIMPACKHYTLASTCSTIKRLICNSGSHPSSYSTLSPFSIESRITLHLVDGWHYLGSLQQTLSLGDCEVRDSNGLDQPLAHRLLHGLLVIITLHISLPVLSSVLTVHVLETASALYGNTVFLLQNNWENLPAVFQTAHGT